MKKFICTLLFFIFLSSASFAGVNRYIVFFDESLEMLQSIADKILLSDSFCLAVPVNSVTYIPENLKKLVSCGKLEPAISFMKDGNIEIRFSFEQEMWDEKIVFIDFYIDLNNINGMGSTTMLAGVNGF